MRARVGQRAFTTLSCGSRYLSPSPLYPGRRLARLADLKSLNMFGWYWNQTALQAIRLVRKSDSLFM